MRVLLLGFIYSTVLVLKFLFIQHLRDFSVFSIFLHPDPVFECSERRTSWRPRLKTKDTLLYRELSRSKSM